MVAPQAAAAATRYCGVLDLAAGTYGSLRCGAQLHLAIEPCSRNVNQERDPGT